jgi:hypothetical protein
MKCLRINHTFIDLITLIGLSPILEKHTTEKTQLKKTCLQSFSQNIVFFLRRIAISGSSILCMNECVKSTKTIYCNGNDPVVNLGRFSTTNSIFLFW